MASCTTRLSRHRGQSQPRPASRPSVACRAGASAPSLMDRLASLFTQSNGARSSSSAPLRPTALARQAASSIVQLARLTSSGTAATPETRREIVALARQLRDEAPSCSGSAQAAKVKLTGTWKQAFSTEKETLAIFSTLAPLFRTRGEAAYQVIDAEAGRLQNVITFTNGAVFVVDSTLEVVESSEEEEEEQQQQGPLPLRCSFRFTGAALKLPSGKEWRLPPAGKGWFDTLYVDDQVRVAFDIRNDWLVVERDGPPRWF
jgi:hypothetical protein